MTRVKLDLTGRMIEVEGSEEFIAKYLEEFKALMRETPAPSLQDRGESHAKGTTASPKPSAKKTKTKAKGIQAEKFDLHKSESKPSLKEFFDQKSPGTNNGNRVAVIAYYIKRMNDTPTFSEGNIDYAYRILELKGRPNHLHQVLINNKNERDLFEPVEGDGMWELTRTGEIFVEEKLPAQNGPKS
jgi:hypothetical protein